MIGNGFMFEDDNGPKHTASAVKAYSDRKTHNGKLSVLDWPLTASASTLLKYCAIILTENRKKGSPDPKTNLPSRSLENTSINYKKITGGTYHEAVSVYPLSCLKGTERNINL